MRKLFKTALLALAATMILSALSSRVVMASEGDDDHHHRGKGKAQVLWLDHFALLPGASDITTTFNSTSSGVGGGLTGLVITSATTGDTFPDGGNKVVQMAAEVPPDLRVTGVRICYELTNTNTFIEQVRLAQVQDPPATALVLLDELEPAPASTGPVCVNTSTVLSPPINPQKGALLLDLRINVGDTSQKIVVRGLALLVNDTF